MTYDHWKSTNPMDAELGSAEPRQPNNNDRVVANLAHLAHHCSRRAVQERREGNDEAARKYRSDAVWYLEWARRRTDELEPA